DWFDKVASTKRDVVTAKHDHVRLCRQGQLHGTRDVIGGDQGAVMHVGEKREAQTVERRGQARGRHRRLSEAEAMAFVRHTVRDCAGQRTDGCGKRPFESSAASDKHGCGYSSGWWSGSASVGW